MFLVRSAGHRSEVGRGVLEHARPCFASRRSMSMKASAGLQNSGTDANEDDRITNKRRVRWICCGVEATCRHNRRDDGYSYCKEESR
ncbi:uncharacterized protein Nmag_2788 [Natrialba magadii ATCC 43099]|uniref:Uncharacterized protein n=1 Tax=Natrialba magadii (strain ATCC 43099 / DSM 3394 / CCM 3739 / CIP 104546 / IAM 13178 / JCM 8861 / NBRC 102185 / NCIMB 2190 / MS3) TaxID=547559 RepID=D3SZT2_NATMM|nr:uncharacterized protein Nmag_2788 [Natrialba magadii ATCC 43099]